MNSIVFQFFHKHKIIFILILVVFAIKLFLFGWAYFINFNYVIYPWNDWINIWDRWDATHYKTIAVSAYNQTSDMKVEQWAFLSHFPPLYPVVIKAVSSVGFTLPVSGILVSLISVIIASIILYKLVILEFKNQQSAFLAVLFFNLFPLSYFTVSIYSESLFILLAIASFYFLRKEKFFISGLLAAGAILTRNIGIVFIPIYFLYCLHFYFKNRKINWSLLYLIIFPILAVFLYMTINKIYYGDYLFFLNEKISFNTTKHLIFPFKETYQDFLAVFKNFNFSNQTFMVTRGWNAVATLLALTITLLGVKRLKWEYTLFSLGSILIFSSLSWGISNARYVFSLFPIFMILGSIENKILQGFILGVFTVGLLYFSQIFTSGAWAF